MKVINKVKEYRKGKKLTQVELAELVGVSRQSIYAIETGKSEPSLELAFKLCKVLDVEIDKVFKLVEAEDANKAEIAPFSLF